MTHVTREAHYYQMAYTFLVYNSDSALDTSGVYLGVVRIISSLVIHIK